MAKDTFYFSHDYNARYDGKIKKLLSKHGYLGYGLFWAIIEDLYNNTNVLRLDYESISFDLRTQPEIVKSIIHDFDLFVFEDDTFGSLSVQKRLEERNEKSQKARESVLKRWANKGTDTNVLQPNNDSNTIKERKEKEKKDIITANILEIVNYLNQKTGKKFSDETKATQSLLSARLKKYTVDDAKKVIDTKVQQWKGGQMDKYLSPDTLFAEKNFEKYLNETPSFSDEKKKYVLRNHMGSHEFMLTDAELTEKLKGGHWRL